MSPISATKPDPNVKIGETDMNSWANVQPGSTQKFEGGTWETYQITFTPVASVQKAGGTIVFRQISGAAEVWCDGKMLAQKTDLQPGELSVPLPAEPDQKRTLSVLIDSGGAPKAGLSGLVIVKP
jgi:beta-galactosidase